MDTVLNLGLNDASVETVAKSSGDERFAFDSYRRFIQMYSHVVVEVDDHEFEDILEHYKDSKGYSLDTDLNAKDWRAVIVEYKAKVAEATGKPFPHEPKDQLWGSIGAVFSSWMNQRAITYRRLNNIPADWGTAVNVPIATGLPASPGAASGEIVFSADDAAAARQAVGDRVDQRLERGVDDVVRHSDRRPGLPRPVAEFDQDPRHRVGAALEDPHAVVAQLQVLDMLGVRANAETPTDARVGRSFGAEGIGLCRTEHMFFEGERIVAMREMILAETEEGRRAALAKLLPMQRQDFADLFEIMSGLPVTIRLLDPPLHEFLPKTDEEIDEVSKAMGVPADKLRTRSAELHEFNPMLGFRGIRLAVRYPEIAEMQARAIFEGAVEAGRKTGTPITAEIMLPVIFGRPEFDLVKPIIVAAAEAVAKETGVTVPYHVGTMIELPRAALRAGEIAESAEFFSFGTNDLTQTTLGISRDDAASFLGIYTAKGLLPADPFMTLDTVGVGELIKIATERGRAVRPNLKVGICGEHGGDPASIAFCETVHLDYVSCSPFRIPIARLAAAQAALGRKAHSTA
jgi:phosphoenolpyruvate synthase/pyruvate phosphate dikinase